MIKIYNADFLSGSVSNVDVFVTSPPYNLDIKYHSYKDNLSREDYLEWVNDWAFAIRHSMSDSGSFFLNFGGKPSKPELVFDVVGVMLLHFTLQNTFHWIKSISIGEDSYGHFKPINSGRYVNDQHEYIFHLTKRGDVKIDREAIGVPYKDKSNIARWGKHSDIRCRGNTWFIPYETVNSKKQHPAAFPVALPEMCLRLHGLSRIKLACDPFLGSGSTAIACKRLGLDFVGFEIDREYYKMAVDNVSVEQVWGLDK